MDPKKKALTPELKQIYDRVMNTQIAPKSPSPATTPTPQTDPAVPPIPVASTPQATQEITSQYSTNMSQVPTLGGNSSAPITTTPPIPGTTSAASMPEAVSTPTNTTQNPLPPPGPDEAKNFLSSVPPRPVSDNGAFVFTGNKVQTPEKKDAKPGQKTDTKPHPTTTGDKKISMPIIAILVVVLIVVWGIFWAKILGVV